MNINNENDIIKRLAVGGDLIAKDGTSGFSKDELEAAMDIIAESRRNAGESQEQSLVRVIQEGDTSVVKLLTAIDALHVQNDMRKASPDQELTKARLHRSASVLLEAHVEKNRGAAESIPQTYARLARDRDSRFTEIYNHLAQVRDL